MDTTTALIYDAVHLFAVALHELSQFQDIQIKPLDCTGETSWPHGSSLINYMKLAEFNGLSGRIKFDTQGLRTVFDIDVLELQQTGLEPIGMNSYPMISFIYINCICSILGTWSIIDTLNLTRVAEVVDSKNPINIMANKTFVVTSIENPPYTMLKEEV